MSITVGISIPTDCAILKTFLYYKKEGTNKWNLNTNQ